MKSATARVLFSLVIGLLAVSALAIGQSSPAPLGIVPTPTPTPLSVSVWTDRTTYTIGENVGIYFSVSQPAYVYIYDIQPDGVVRLIFPNAYEQGNYVSAGTHSLPNGLYQFTVQPPTGLERLQIFASPSPLGLSPSSYGEPFPMIGVDPQVATGQIEVQIKGISPEPLWATGWTSFTISQYYGYTPPTTPAPPSYPTPPTYYPTPPTYYPTPPTYYQTPPTYYQTPPTYSQQPPFPGIIGATWYFLGGQWISGIPSSGSYWYWHNPCGYSYTSCGVWRIRIRISFGIRIGTSP
jgi:Domain of unknown function (DUF4384)